MSSAVAYVGLGSNLADPLQQLASAIAALATLPQTTLLAQSPFYASRPVGPQDQPDFINGAVQLSTILSPLALLDELQRIEQEQGRVRIEHWGPRTLDLDLLLYGDDVIHNERLTVPHRELENRDFVLQPLLDLTPSLRTPEGIALATLRQQCSDNRLRQLKPAAGQYVPHNA